MIPHRRAEKKVDRRMDRKMDKRVAKRMAKMQKMSMLDNETMQVRGRRDGDETWPQRRERILAERARIAAKWRPKIPRVQRLNLEHFKNRYQGDQPEHAIEVLVVGPKFREQVRREQVARRREEIARIRRFWLYGSTADELMRIQIGMKDAEGEKSRKGESNVKGEGPEKSGKPEADPPGEGLIQRVRIHSHAVLYHLTQFLNETERRSTARTFCRPFRALIYFQPRMKKALEELEEKAKAGALPDAGQIHPSVSRLQGEAGDDEGKEDKDGEHSDAESLVTEGSDDVGNLETMIETTSALDDMRCYVQFVDNDIMPLYNKYDNTENRGVMFDDLWCMFRTGELIYVPAGGDDADSVWRLYRIECPVPESSYPGTGSGWDLLFEDMNPDSGDFILVCYYIDHSGTSFGAVRHKFVIKPFPGERQVESLEAYPLRFLENSAEVLERLTRQGRDFQRYLEDRHQNYNAWTLTRNPPGDFSEDEDDFSANALRDEQGRRMRHPEFIESDVIIDLAEAFQTNPDWRPDFHRPSLSKSISANAEEDSLPIQQWADRSRTRLIYTCPEIIQTIDGVELIQRRENLHNVDLFLRQRSKETRKYENVNRLSELREEDLALLPRRMFAYALRDRRFILIDTRFLKPILREEGIFERLKILRDYKDIIRGLVGSHFQKKKLERELAKRSTPGLSQDLIQGKGRGLVILLHGVPGVGKTATAEAVAIENRKPLFVITCGDLGLTPNDVESSLSNIFRLAHLWDCVLLLDEADVFLSQRSRLDMKRNALVSVFLRVLEYYSGLLFLTTNRVGSVDEAFKSRIHISLYYPSLGRTQTREIFKTNLAKLREIEEQRSKVNPGPTLDVRENEILEFAESHFDTNSESGGRWNGRQIRNAFQITSSLAYHNFAAGVERAHREGCEPPSQPILNRALFEKVQETTRSFDSYMREAKGWNDADLAFLLGERADHFKNRRANETTVPVTYSPEPSSYYPTPAMSTASSYHQGMSYGTAPLDYGGYPSQPGGSGYHSPEQGGSRQSQRFPGGGGSGIPSYNPASRSIPGHLSPGGNVAMRSHQPPQASTHPGEHLQGYQHPHTPSRQYYDPPADGQGRGTGPEQMYNRPAQLPEGGSMAQMHQGGRAEDPDPYT